MADVLLIGPERDRAEGVRQLLREDGHRVRWLRDVDDWANAERSAPTDLVVATVRSAPAVVGARPRRDRGFPAPILFVQHETDFHHELQLQDRLIDRLESPFLSEELLARCDALVRVRRVVLKVAVPERSAHEEAVGPPDEEGGPSGLSRLTSRLGAWLGRRVPRYAKPLGPYLEVAARLADWADARDGFDPGHAERVASLCGMMADALGMTDARAASLIRAALLHDIGKVALPVELLRHRGPLHNEQMRLVRTHPKRGVALLRALDDDREVADTILFHHERADGHGYYETPFEMQPVASRILAVAETYDAMTRSRVRPPLSPGDALESLESQRGAAFDSECVDALVSALRPRRSIPVSTILA